MTLELGVGRATVVLGSPTCEVGGHHLKVHSNRLKMSAESLEITNKKSCCK